MCTEEVQEYRGPGVVQLYRNSTGVHGYRSIRGVQK